MKHMHKLFAITGLLLASIGPGNPLLAQCGGVAKHIAYPSPNHPRGARLQLASLPQMPEPQGFDHHDGSFEEPIVGLWKMDFEDPADNYSDKGYAVWHSDHTEFMNSTRPPSVGSVCQGVWERVGESTYRLNHFALAYGDTVTLTSVYRIQAVVTVDSSRDRFSGRFTIEAFDPKTHAPQGTFKGPVTGERIKIHTKIDSQDF